MATAVLRPIASVLQEWTQLPVDGQPHYTKVDEPVANFDSAVTELRSKVTLKRERMRLEPLPSDFDALNSATIRQVVRGAPDGTVSLSLDVNLYVDNVLKFTSNKVFTTLVAYVVYEIPVATLALAGNEVLELEWVSHIVDEDPPSIPNKLFATAVELVVDYNSIVFTGVTEPTTDFSPVVEPTTNFSTLVEPTTVFVAVPEGSATFTPASDGVSTTFTVIPLD